MENKDVVIAFLMALNNEDFKDAKTYLGDNMKFVGVMGATNGSEEYIKSMEKMRFKYDIKKIIADGDDVSVFVEINMGAAKILCSNWYHVTDNKIDSLKSLFNPRPLLDAQKK